MLAKLSLGPADYCATLNHECVHATGVAHRVGRDLAKRFAHHERAVEALIAQIGAAILGAHLHLPPHHIFDHGAYIGSWMRVLAHDKRAVLPAGGQAQVAVDWLLDKSPAPEAFDVAA
ncbi:MAG: zincin-like metallopeptidase domain-containing protein [Hyphomonadaceae bacterium JAD_PAG50586_4]|nr:MAG: zincin-like metallopeptidase domain-containing protein [Hyphomonadaceae bacterium JAD_PAG50586_4]